TVDTRGGADWLDGVSRNNFGIETLQIDTAWHYGDPVPGCAITIIDQLCNLLTRCYNAITTRHDAVVQVLEEILFTESFIPTGHKLNSAQSCGNQCAPAASSAESVNSGAPPLTRKAGQNECVA